MSSPRALRTGFGSRTLLVSAGLLLVSLAASHITAFRTHVRLTSGPRGMSLTVNGRTIRGAATLGSIREIRIEAPNSVFPMGGERLTVRQNGRLLFEDRLPRHFSVNRGPYAPLGDWYLDPYTGSGIVYEHRIALARDFTIEATFTGRCLDFTSIVVVGDPLVYAQFRRGLLNNDFILKVGGQVLAVDALVSPLPQMALNALDLLLRGLIAGCVLVLSFASVRLLLPPREHRFRPFFRRAWSGMERHWPALVAGGLALIALAIRLWVSGRVLEALAHTPDEVAYMLQSKWIVSNNVYEVASQIQEHLSVPFTYVRDGKWFSMYPIGWPLLLAIGQLGGLSWIVSPVCGAVYVLLLFLIGRELYGDLVGLAAATLGALSPMAILMSASYLSHASAAMMIALFLWLYLIGRGRSSSWLCGLSGASLGFAFAIRPMTALTVALPFAFIVLREFSRSKEKREMLRQSAAFLVGGVLGSAPVFISNQMITGHAFSFTYAYGANQSFSSQNLPAGLMYLDATAASVLPAVYGWGWGTLSGWPILSLTLAFAYVPFLVGRARRVDGLLAAFLITLPLSFLTWGFHGLHGYGPRFYFEAFLGLYLMTAEGFFLLAGIDATTAPLRLRRGRIVAGLGIGLLTLLTLSALLTLRPRMRLYSGYNYVDGSLEKAIARQRVRRALILFPNDDWFSWGAASNLLKADLHADIAFAASRGDNSKLYDFYPRRPVYIWESNQLVPAALPPSASVARPSSRETSTAPGGGKVTTLLAWWLALSAIGVGASVLFGRMTRSFPTPATDRSSPRVSPAEVPTIREARSRGRIRSSVRIRVPRPALAILGIMSAYAGQILLTPGGLASWRFLWRFSENQRFHAGWLLLVIGAVLFGLAWRGFDREGEPAGASEVVDAGKQLPPAGNGSEAGSEH
jgi:hypothetical protein